MTNRPPFVTGDLRPHGTQRDAAGRTKQGRLHVGSDGWCDVQQDLANGISEDLKPGVSGPRGQDRAGAERRMPRGRCQCQEGGAKREDLSEVFSTVSSRRPVGGGSAAALAGGYPPDYETAPVRHFAGSLRYTGASRIGRKLQGVSDNASTRHQPSQNLRIEPIPFSSTIGTTIRPPSNN